MNIYDIRLGFPTSWEDLQNKTCKILKESMWDAETEKKLETVRGNVEIDVYAVNKYKKPKSTILIECKFWKNPIPQEVVYGLRSKMNDVGANHGFIISRNGFNSGAFEKSKFTNIQLVNWEGFLEVFGKPWLSRRGMYLLELDFNLSYYCNHFNPIKRNRFQELESLSEDKLKLYNKLVNDTKKSEILGISLSSKILEMAAGKINYPIQVESGENELRFDFLDDFFDTLIQSKRKRINKFDEIFERKIRGTHDSGI